MKIHARIILAAAAIILVISPANAANRVALVIGNGAYEKVPLLPNPTRDAAAIGDSLSRLGFTVTRLKDATASAMRKSIIEFGRAAVGSEMAVVFYAGHGMEVGGENWLIPVDAELRSDTDVENEAVSLKGITLQVGKASQLGLVMLDACRNNPFSAKMQRSLNTRSVSRGLASTEPTDNVLVAYAAKDGTVANDGDGKNSPFTKALLRHLEVPGLEITFMFRAVRDEVMTETRREQQPFVYGSLSKEAIYLKPLAPVQTPAALPPTIAKPAADPKPPAAQETSKESANSRSGVKRNSYSSDDAQRVSAVAAEQELKMPPFAIGETTSDVPDSYALFVGIWSNKAGFGEGTGRHVMMIVTEVTSDGMALGYYLWGPPKKLSWDRGPAGYANFAAKISGGKLEFKSGDVPIDVKLSGFSMTLHTSNPRPQGSQSKSAMIKLSALWRLSSPDSPAARREPSERPRTVTEPEKPKSQGPKVAQEDVARPGKLTGTSMEDRYRACRKLVKGFAQREACARNGGT
ncbi:MAG: caspase family protein [Bradyrhizobium sp.]